METKNNKTLTVFMGVLVLFMSLSLLVAGCSKTTPSPVNTAQGDLETSQDAPAVPNTDDQTTANASEDIAADKRSAVEANEDTLISLLPDGVYEKEVTYAYHSGEETIDIKITVEGDIITEATIASVGDTHQVSQNYINKLNAELPTLVVGKKINELDIPKQVAGSSLTTAAFKGYVNSLIAG